MDTETANDPKMDVDPNKEPQKQEFESRAYQTELYELALKNNVILYLPTGSGKTYISILLLKALGRDLDLNRKIEDGGQRTFFLVNTVALVSQQSNQIRMQTPYIVGGFSGDMGVDHWEPEVWRTQLNSYQVFVMTCQIFLDLLQMKVLSLRNANLLIFDECHRAVSNHPMRQIMQNFKNIPTNELPKILGLTATLLNGNIKPSNVASEIRSLEITLMSQIATSINEDLVKLHSTNPRESKVTYTKNETTGVFYKMRDFYLDQCNALTGGCQIEEVASPSKTPNTQDIRLMNEKANKTNKRLKNAMEDIKVNMDELGVYGGSMAVLVHMVQIQQMIPNVPSDVSLLLYQFIITQLCRLRKYLEENTVCCGETHVETLRSFSSDKVIKLFDILKKLKPTDSAIVFVQRRFSAKILFYLVKRAAEVDPKLNHIKCNFIVGYNIGNPFKDTRENYVQRHQNKKVMNLFNQGVLNVLFASNVVEEGVDISKCNYVIMYDLPQDFRAYTQSKGRARDKNSNYILMVSSSDIKFDSKYTGFRQVENVLKQILSGGKSRNRSLPTKEELEKSLFLETPGLEPFRPKGPHGPVITALSAIPMVNRYFASLKQDKFTKITPFWWLKEDIKKGMKCLLQLPMESKVKDLIEGTWQHNSEDAKRSAALEACKKLYACEELDEINLLPAGIEMPEIKANVFTPNQGINEEEIEIIGDKKRIIGSKKHKRLSEKKWADCLCKCRPEPHEQCYLHLLSMKPKYTPAPDNNRLKVVHQFLCESSNFALLTTKILPKLASFPLYMNTGELEATVKSHQPIVLDEDQLQLIIDFHSVIFDKVLALTKRFMIRDLTNTQNAFLIIPVIPGSTEEVTIDWNVMLQAMKPFPSIQTKPSPEDRKKLNITDEDYFGAVVSPWYREVPDQKYIVTKVCHEMSENTKFPNEAFGTYKDYYDDKYKLKPLITDQPLLEVRAFSSKLNSIKPRAMTKQFRRKNKEDNEEFEVWLLPEFCVAFPLPGRYWLKALLLPSVLHRISQLCMAEELRCLIVKEAGVGILQLPPGANWKKLQEDASLIKKEKVCETHQALTPLSMPTTSHSPSNSGTSLWENEQEPVDIERSVDSASIFDILTYNRFVNKPLQSKVKAEQNIQNFTENTKRRGIVMIEPPTLVMLQRSPSGIGPDQIEVMQALVIAGANDFVSCERLETLGDAFLKFAISLILFETQPDLKEGQLTNLKGRIVGNKNLYACGQKKNLGCILQAHDFSPNEEWVPPGFCVEHSIQSVIRQARISPNCLYLVDIPEEERRAGMLSAATNDRISEIMLDAEDAIPQNCTFINQQALTNKNVADAVEAILGAYLKSSGVLGALEVLNWFGVTITDLARPEVFLKRVVNSPKGKGRIDRHLIEPHLLEETLNYKFRDRIYMLEALSHPSYSSNDLTIPYQRLEFIGDAIIDFLITIHIFEKCVTLSPGDLTDLRSALVNNITLACIVVRNNIHKFMLHRSSMLNDFILRFAKHQEDRGHVVDDDILFLFEEGEVNISEAIEVPKALGDIFEALVGAIYLDSGKDLNLTWKIVYNLMKDEIDAFCKKVPKNHVRMIYESNCCPDFKSSIVSNGVVMVTIEVIVRGNQLRCNGFGDTKQQAKRAAAKHALRLIRSAN